MNVGAQELDPVRLKTHTTRLLLKGKEPDPEKVIAGVALAYKDIVQNDIEIQRLTSVRKVENK